MARQIVDVALVEADGQELETVESIEIQDTDPSAEVVKTMNRRRRGIGYKQGVPDFEVTLTLRKTNPPEFDWHGYRRTGRIFPIVYEEADGGQRYKLVDCKVVELSKSFNADGEVTDSVRILALDHKPEA